MLHRVVKRTLVSMRVTYQNALTLGSALLQLAGVEVAVWELDFAFRFLVDQQVVGVKLGTGLYES